MDNSLYYYNIPYEQLPSRGKLYPEGSSIAFRPLTFGEVKRLSLFGPPDVLSWGAAKLEGMSKSDLLKMDELPIKFFIRANTFISANSYELDFTCPYCQSRTHWTFNLGDLEIKGIEESKLRSGDISGFHVSGRYERALDRHYRDEDPEIELILNWTNVSEAPFFTSSSDLLNLPAGEYARLLQIAKTAEFGVRDTVVGTCSSCQKTSRIRIDLSEHNLFPKMSMKTLVKNKVEVSKYCGINLSDETMYNEVELTIQVVNELAKQEQEMMRKTNGDIQRRFKLRK